MKIKNFDTIEKAQEYVNGFKGAAVPELADKTKEEEAQELVYEAYEKTNTKERLMLAYKALHYFPDCAAAYNMIAEEDSDSDGKMLESFMKGEEAGRRCLGEDFIRENKGSLWAYIAARPYMRAMEGVANGLWRTGRRNEAIKKCREILELNEKDNQGIRYTLVTFLTEEQKFQELDAFMKTGVFKDDYDIEWFYTKPLVSFAMSGDSAVARKAVETAVNRNPHVIKYMAGSMKIPETLPDKFTPNSEEEAVIYVANNLASWFMIPEAFDWFVDTARVVISQKHETL